MARQRKPPALRAAERQLEEARFAIKAHRKHCSRCHVAIAAELFANACDLGWSYLKLERRAVAQLERVQADQDALSDRQLALW